MGRAKRRILAVDDEELWAGLLRTWFEGAGYEARTADSGAEALRAAAEWEPDCVVLDYVLPDMNGSEVCRRLRGLEAARTVPIVLLTGHAREKIQGLQSGADYFIQKSEKPDELLAILEALFRRRRMDAGIAAVGEVSLDPRDRTVRVGEETAARLSPKTFELFHLLLTRYPAPVDKRELFKTLEGRDEIGVSRALDLLLNRLRKAVGPALADRIKSVKGYGYVYIDAPSRER